MKALIPMQTLMLPMAPTKAEAQRLGAALLALREARRLTRRELAGLAQVDAGTPRRLERGLFSPRRGTLVRLLTALGMAPEDLAAFLADHAAGVAPDGRLQRRPEDRRRPRPASRAAAAQARAEQRALARRLLAGDLGRLGLPVDEIAHALRAGEATVRRDLEALGIAVHAPPELAEGTPTKKERP